MYLMWSQSTLLALHRLQPAACWQVPEAGVAHSCPSGRVNPLQLPVRANNLLIRLNRCSAFPKILWLQRQHQCLTRLPLARELGRAGSLQPLVGAHRAVWVEEPVLPSFERAGWFLGSQTKYRIP